MHEILSDSIENREKNLRLAKQGEQVIRTHFSVFPVFLFISGILLVLGQLIPFEIDFQTSMGCILLIIGLMYYYRSKPKDEPDTKRKKH